MEAFEYLGERCVNILQDRLRGIGTLFRIHDANLALVGVSMKFVALSSVVVKRNLCRWVG